MDGEEFLRPQEWSALMMAAVLIRRICRDCIRFIIRSLPFLIRALAIGGGLAAAVWAIFQTWGIFGGDAAAFVLALLVGVIPLAYAMQWRISFGGILAAGLVSLTLAYALMVVPEIVRVFLVVCGMAVLVIIQMARRNITPEFEVEVANYEQR